MSDSVRPHRQQPTGLPRPWDSPGKNTGVGCHFLLQCVKVKSDSELVQSCLTPSDPMDCSPPGSSVHGIFQARVLEWGTITFSGAMLSQSLIQFSVDGRGCVPSLLLTRDQTMVEVMKIMAASFKTSRARTAVLSEPDPAAGHR